MSIENNYFIIAGTNKAGTTSFFEYLASHPDICPAYLKQTFFFLDREWQHHWGMKSVYNYEKGLHQFDRFFKKCSAHQHKLEATPDYLYAPDCPKRLRIFFKDHKGKILFILRHPVKRFISLYYFGKQQGLIPAEMDFTTFRKQSERYKELDNMSLLAYNTGFYSRFIERYYHYFPKDQILIYFFENLVHDPVKVMRKVALDLRIDPDFYSDFDFQNFNTTVKVKSRLMEDAYNAMRSALIHSVYKTRWGYSLVEKAKRVIRPLYTRINTVPLEKELIPEAEIQYLEKVYANEAENLARLTGLKVPWPVKATV